MEGWVSVHRKLLNNPITCKDGDHLAVWIYLLLNATHKEISTIFRGKKITLLPGQLIVSRNEIAKKLKISDSKIKRVLNEFKIDQQIDQQSSNQNTLISIINWQMYQKSDQRNDQQMTNERPTSDQPSNNNNVINIYILLLNKYSKEIQNKKFGERIKIINELRNTEEYQELSYDEQQNLFNKLMSLK